jgi:carbon monoxide dehydrogenase subunit G
MPKGEHPMYQFEKSILINRPQQEVFDYVTDPANDAKYQSGSEAAEWTSEGPVGVGSTLRSVNKFMGRKIEGISEVTAWDPPNQYAQKSVGGPVPFEMKMVLAAKDNGTQLTLSGQAELGGFFKLAEGLVGKQLEKQMEGDLETLKRLMEAG